MKTKEQRLSSVVNLLTEVIEDEETPESVRAWCETARDHAVNALLDFWSPPIDKPDFSLYAKSEDNGTKGVKL